ncbi:HU family DNA-binding protein [Aliifodinibius salicampi]|uniref:HU family DNA-binding protein n=1 Tax=Fodinibius salicampi TaxID=1920655 RepID=A0ABT3Q2N4_9BACT|nr:SPOR domain-containing protein [Fodinibius salicampi]MCW9714356.1 HU family DNA-binding protein [Fodinibius salicampi]
MTTIDREQLIDSLVERTGMDRSSVAQQFEKLESRIQKARTAEAPFEIENFGTFTTVENQLEFIPDDVLETEINNRYAGMKPIELIEAFKSPEGEPVPVADSPIGQSDVKEYEKKPSDQSENGDKEESPKEQPEKPKKEPAPVGEHPQTRTTEEEPNRPEKEEVADTSTTGIATKDQRDEKAKEAAEKKGKRPAKDPIGQTVLVIALILGLAIAGWMAYDFGLFGSEATSNGSPDNAQQSAIGQSQETDLGPESSIGQTEDEEESGQKELPVEENSGSGNESGSSPVESDDPYGMYGNIQEAAGNYYTIVVHSMQTIPQAEEKQQEVLEQGNYRTEIKEANVNGSTYYRIGIGQFETIDAAQKAAEELPEPYRSNNFISRF